MSSTTSECASASESSQRVVVFIDEANVYNDARRCFHAPATSSVDGRFCPDRYARHLATQTPHGAEGDPRHLAEVRVYTGSPANGKDPKAYGAHRRQRAYWEKRGAAVMARPISYRGAIAQQKGVDVQLAIDVVRMALLDELDVAIVASTDTDLVPALDMFHQLPELAGKTAEVAAWKSSRYGGRLQVKSGHLWCHFLGEDVYRSVRDLTNYASGASSKAKKSPPVRT